MKKLLLETWLEGDLGAKKIVNIDEVKKVVDLYQSTVYTITNIDITEADKLNQKLKQFLKDDCLDCSIDLERFLKSEGYSDFEIDFCGNIESPKDILVFCDEFMGNEFGNLADYETIDYYKYWNGSNWIEVFPESITEVDISENYINIDETDFNGNITTGGTGRHCRIYRVLNSDDYLINYISQWQNEHETAEIMNITEIENLLEDNNRDIQKYLPLIENL
jgi:hypothetical protein